MSIIADVVSVVVSSETFKVISVMFFLAIFIVLGNYLNRYLLTRLLILQKKKLSENEINSLRYSSSSILLEFFWTIFSSFFINEKKRENRYSHVDEVNQSNNNDVSIEVKTIKRIEPELKENKSNTKPSIKDFYYFINMELSTASKTRAVYINMYMAFTIAIIFFFFFFNEMSFPVRITLSGAYISYSLFSVYIIKTSYRRISLMLSLLEDCERKSDIADFFTKYKKGKDLNSYDIEFLKMLTISRAEREKSVNHPYEVIFNNLNDSNVEINRNGMKLSRNKNKK